MEFVVEVNAQNERVVYEALRKSLPNKGRFKVVRLIAVVKPIKPTPKEKHHE